MDNLLTLQYWFNLNPGPFLNIYLRIIYGAVILLLAAGIVAWLFIKKNNKDFLIQFFWQKVQTFCFTAGIVVWALVFSRQQRIGFLGMPFLLALVFAGVVIWIFFIMKYLIKTMPKRRAEQRARAEKEKYLKK
ncbi:MAG: hypothetical protein ABIJ91_03175 [Candidatus Kuenenbacteria bacterium]